MNIGILTRYKLLLVVLAIVSSSCSRAELLGYSGGGDVVQLNLKVDAPAATAAANNETDINRLRIVIFGSIGSPDAGKLILNKYHAITSTGTHFKEIITAGKRDIFIIANEPLSGGGQELDSYKNIATVADIRKLSLVYDGAVSVGTYTPAEIPMFIEHQNKQVSVNIDNEVSGAVERTMAKVTMKLNVKNENFPADKFVVIDNMVIKNLPQISFLKSNIYSDVLVTSERQNTSVVTVQSGYDFSSNNTFYVPEYIFNDPDKGAYFEITGHVNGEPDRVAKWKVKLGDAMDDAGTYGTRYDITRNRHYVFTGDVKSYGEMDLAVRVTVKPWNAVDLPENVGGYVSYINVTDAAGSVIADGAELDGAGTTLKVSCSTSVGGWYTITSNADGKVTHIGTPTAAISAVTTQTVDIVIPPPVDLTSVMNYAVNIYHPTIAPESVGPIKALHFKQKVPTYITINGLKWAAGNLVADGSNDAKIGAPGDYGLYFQFGSLVGWSGGASGDGVGTGEPSLAIKVKPSTYSGYNSYPDCGHYDTGSPGTELPTTDDAATGIGDPCRFYLGSPWRTPTKTEHLALSNSGSAWVTSPANGRDFNTSGSTRLYLPASGLRGRINGSLGDVGQTGCYWSASVGGVSDYDLNFNKGGVTPQGLDPRQFGFPVRCVEGALLPAAISLNTTTQASIPPIGNSYIVEVTSNYNWSMSSTVSGVTFSPSLGVVGVNVPVEVTVPANTLASLRSIPVVFTATGGGTTATATWTGSQLAAPANAIPINGLWWATGNLVANGSYGAKVGAPGDYGLYFQFGSLVGWSGGASGDGVGTGEPALALRVKPSTYSGSTDYTTCGYYSAGSSGTIPSTDNATTGIGDPCRYYLGSPWRTPTTAEYQALNGRGSAWVTSPADGRNFNTSGSTQLFLPASRYRDADGLLVSVGMDGYYWSASVRNASDGYLLIFYSGRVTPQFGDIRQKGSSVRCVQ